MSLSRRELLRHAAGLPLLGALQGLARFTGSRTGSQAGYGPLVRTAASNTGEHLLELPDGFQYTVFGRTGDPMADGRPTPPDHDGMAAFDTGGELRLVRNHEVRGLADGADASDVERAYDPLARGGTSTLVVDPETRELVKSFASLRGTAINCAGGPTPWGSWISCEETTAGPSDGFTRAHGYCFEVPAGGNTVVDPVPLRAMGRFVHEAIAVDPATGIVYLTEDQGTAGLYRFIPDSPGRLAEGGRLQMLSIRGRNGHDTRTGQKPFESLPVRWVDIDNPDPASAESNPQAVLLQGTSQGAAVFARLEGAWYGNGKIYIDSTTGGDRRLGQIWEHTPAPEGGTLRLIFESGGRHELGNPDNICVSPRGTGIVICEDGSGVQRVHGLTLDGHIYEFIRNTVPGHETDEFAGSTFSPDGRTLFVNIQRPGLTFAIWGDWSRGNL